MAVIGDADQFVTMGKKRIASITDDGEIRVTVAFASGETARVITGYAPVPPQVQAVEGGIGPVSYAATTGIFAAPVAPGQTGSATIVIRKGREPRRPIGRGE
jgi:hypothetical protein